MNKFKIIEKPDYTLAVFDKEIKEGQIGLFYDFDYNKITKKAKDVSGNRYFSKRNIKKIIGYQPKGNAPELDGLQLLPEMKDDVEKLALDYAKQYTPTIIDQCFYSFKAGYKAATKGYSEDDLRKAFERGFSVATHLADYKTEEEWSKFINSLKQPKPKWFVAEQEWINSKGEKGNSFTDVALYEDSIKGYDAVLQLKTTTINGKTYLAGKYEF